MYLVVSSTRVRDCSPQSTEQHETVSNLGTSEDPRTHLVTVCVHDSLRGIALSESLSVSLAVRVVLRARVLEEVRALHYWLDT